MDTGPTPTRWSRALLLRFGTAGLFFHASAEALTAFKPRLGSHGSEGVLRGHDSCVSDREPQQETQKLLKCRTFPTGLNSHLLRPWDCHPAATHPELAGIWFTRTPAELVGSVDAFGTGFRADTKCLFASVNLDTLKKKENDRNTEDAVGHQPWFQSHGLAAQQPFQQQVFGEKGQKRVAFSVNFYCITLYQYELLCKQFKGFFSWSLHALGWYSANTNQLNPWHYNSWGFN